MTGALYFAADSPCCSRSSSGTSAAPPIAKKAGEIRTLEAMEADMIRLALARYQGQMSEVARKLGIKKFHNGNAENIFIAHAFRHGKVRVLVTKPKIGAWGLNWQHCNHMTFFPSHSFEQYYQSVRRCCRFGQTRPVTVDVVTTEGESSVLKNLQRKSEAADKMFDRLVEHMNEAQHIDRMVSYSNAVEVPSWL